MDLATKFLQSSRFNKFLFPFFVLLIAILYYLIFVPLGLDFGDEGYALYTAKRILLGEVLYKDVYWIYTPGQVVVLSFLFKYLAPEILVGRFYTLFIHIGILCCHIYLLRKFKVTSFTSLIILFASIAFGLPLMNIPYVVLPAVFFSLLTLIFYITFLLSRNYLFLFLLGVGCAAILFFKQNAGVYFYGLASLLLFFQSFPNRTSRLFINGIFHSVFWVLTSAWVIPLFLNGNAVALQDFLGFSFYFRDSFLFTYPPLSMIFEGLGVFKLIPYYLPILSGIYMLYLYSFTRINRVVILPLLFALVGFAGNMYPGTDLLHVYPFYSSIVVGLSIVLFFKNHTKLLYFILFLNIAIGVYLTFFRGHLRYESPYKDQTVPLSVEGGDGLYTYSSKAKGTQELVEYMKKNTSGADRVLVYPFAPMVYFFLDNKNISKDSVFHPATATMLRKDLTEVLRKQRYYIITIGNYRNETQYSRFISEQNEVFSTEFYRVYKIE